MDNVRSHGGSDALALSNVTDKFLPANTTSHLQPLNGGIIQAFKMRYRQKLMEYILAHVETFTSGTTLAEQIKCCEVVWQGMGGDLRKYHQVQNCGFKWGGARGSDAEDHEATQTESCGELLAAAEASGVCVYITLEQFVAIDENIATESMDDWEEDLVRSE